MSLIELSKYRECQDCKKQFILTNLVLKYETKNISAKIYCPYCQSFNVAIIPKEDFRRVRK